MSTPLSIDELQVLIERQANLLIETGTGGRPFKEVEPEYQKLDALVVSSLRRLKMESPFPWRSLWEWYGYYSSTLPTYGERRIRVGGLKRLALDRLTTLQDKSIHDPAAEDETPDWAQVSARVSGLVDEYTAAKNRDDWQDVGRRSREVLIDLGKLVRDPALVPEGQPVPKDGDARAWFDLRLAARATGPDRKELRALMRSTWDMAQKVTHGDIDDVDAFAAAQATVLLVRTTQRLTAQRM